MNTPIFKLLLQHEGIIVLCAVEECCKYFALHIFKNLRKYNGGYLLVAFGFALMENYLYLSHAVTEYATGAYLLMIGVGRMSIGIPAHMAYAGTMILMPQKLIGFISAILLHATINMSIASGYLIIAFILLAGVSMLIVQQKQHFALPIQA